MDKFFETIGRGVAAAWWLWLPLWAGLLIASMTWGPSWDELSVEGQSNQMPDDAPTRRARRLAEEAFPGENAESGVAVLARRIDEPLTDADGAFIAGPLADRLQDAVDATDDGYPRVLLPFEFPRGDLQVSADGRTAVVRVAFATPMFGAAAESRAAEVEEAVDRIRADAPAGVELFTTGSVMIGREFDRLITDSTDAIQTYSLWVVLALLLAVFRAPLPTLVPLATMYIAVEVSMAAIGWAAAVGWLTLFDGLEVYTRVLAYGASVDDSVFLIARYREELSAGHDPHAATVRAIRGVGPAVTASAATEIVGIGMLTLAAFGKFFLAGIAIPAALFVTYLSAMTLTFGALRIAGRKAFWPRSIETTSDGPGVWSRIADRVVAKPAAYGGGLLLAMTPLAIWGAVRLDDVNYDLSSELPADSPAMAGLDALRDHFPDGIAG